jgi:tetratricopeptide (TPR) repeat protein
MFVVTFYSYKGGVGRTLALVNCAFRLAKKGKKVFILDFDLEAPGVDAFRLCGDGQPRQGIVEYVSRFRSEGSVQDLGDYVCRVGPEDTQPGEIFFMTAGRKDEEYQVLLSQLDWKYFYKEQKGFLFVENLKAAIEEKYAPDYVLVDSRTGLTDVAGICTLQLPDLVVLLFNLNNQNIRGISRIYRSIRFNKLNKDIKALLVASPIPDVPDYLKVRRERIDYAQETIGAGKISLIVPFDPFVAFEETVLSGGEQSTYLAKSYDRLAEMVRQEHSGDVLTMLERAAALADGGNVDQADLMYREVIATYPGETRALVDYARFLRIREKKEAITYLEKAQGLAPQNPEVVAQLIRTYLSFGQPKKAINFLEQFLTISTDVDELEDIGNAFESKGAIVPARKLYERAVGLADSSEEAPHFDLGNTLMGLREWRLAAEQFELAMKADPSLPVVYNYGRVLDQLGDPRATEYFERAIALFGQKGTEDDTPVGRANGYQAMSHAYIALGKRKKAEELLKKAIEAAKKVPAGQRIFSSVQYKYIPSKEFLVETRLLTRRVGRTSD